MRPSSAVIGRLPPARSGVGQTGFSISEPAGPVGAAERIKPYATVIAAVRLCLSQTPALLWVHVICLCLAWTLLLPSGIVSAMLGRHKPDAWWFKTHQKVPRARTAAQSPPRPAPRAQRCAASLTYPRAQVQAAGVGFLLVGYICRWVGEPK